METNTRVLVVQPDPERADQIRDNLFREGVTEVEWVRSGIDGIACFESFQPIAVLLQADLSELPTRFVIKALNVCLAQPVRPF